VYSLAKNNIRYNWARDTPMPKLLVEPVSTFKWTG
jgi:hypothetical protein